MAPQLLSLPNEVLQLILRLSTVSSFLQITQSCHKIFDVADNCREVVLHHLHQVPGIKIGLDEPTVSTSELFLLLRQRASRHLYGISSTASCRVTSFRNATLDPNASCMTPVDTDYVTMSLVVHDSLAIRLCDFTGHLLDHLPSPYADGKGKVIQVVHKKGTISVLYEWQEDPGAVVPPSDARVAMESLRMKLKSPDVKTEDAHEGDASPAGSDPARLTAVSKKKFHLLHYSAFSRDRPMFFTIMQHRDLVPRQMSVYTRLQVAILWEKESARLWGSNSGEIVYYTANKVSPFEEGVFESRVVWPTDIESRPSLANLTDVPKHIEFFREGRRLRLYGAGHVVPYKVIMTASSYDPRYQTNMVAVDNGIPFTLDCPFYGQHETYTDPQDEDRTLCSLTHLALGTARVGPIGMPILCILRAKTRIDQHDCMHVVSLEKMAHIGSDSCRVAARLWGWQECPTTMTALETVCISKLGTRIAIAMWDKILVWSIDPKILCEDVEDDDENGNLDGSDQETESTQSRRRKKRARNRGVTDDFYERQNDAYLEMKVAQLRPVVLDLHGAVARKMAWPILQIPFESDSDGDEDEDSLEEDGEPREQSNTNSNSSDSGDNASDTGHISSEGSDHSPSKSGHTVDESTVASESFAANLQSRAAPLDKGFTGPNHPVDEVLTLLREGQTDAGILPTEPSLQDTFNETDKKSCSIREVADVKEPDTSNSAGSAVSTRTAISTTETAIPMIASRTCPEAEDKGKLKDIMSNAGQGTSSTETHNDKASRKVKRAQKRQKRRTEDELVVMTDRGIMTWNLGPMGRGTWKTKWMEEQIKG